MIAHPTLTLHAGGATPRPPAERRHSRLVRAIRAILPPGNQLLSARPTPWSSASFVGARHDIRIAMPGGTDRAEAAVLASRLADAELSVPGDLVADLVADVEGEDGAECDGAPVLRLAVLTVEEC